MIILSLLVILSWSVIEFNSKIITKEQFDSLLSQISENVVDSNYIAIVVDSIIYKLESVGIVDPVLEIRRSVDTLWITLKNEKIVHFSKVFLDNGGKEYDYQYLKYFLNKGFFKRTHFDEVRNYFERIELFSIDRYYFLKGNEYSLVLLPRKVQNMPQFFLGYEEGRIHGRGDFGISSVHFYPISFRLSFLIGENRFKSFSGQLIIPVSIKDGFYAKMSYNFDTLGEEYTTGIGKIYKDFDFYAYLMSNSNNGIKIGGRAILDRENLRGVLKLEGLANPKHVFLAEVSKNIFGVTPELVFFKTNFNVFVPTYVGFIGINKGEPLIEIGLLIKNIGIHRTFWAFNRWGFSFILPWFDKKVFFGLSANNNLPSIKDLKIHFGLYKKSPLFDYLCKSN